MDLQNSRYKQLQELQELIKDMSLDERLNITRSDNYKRLSYKVKKDVYNILFSPYYPAICTPDETTI